MSDEHDDEPTRPDLPSGLADDVTPGAGPEAAFAAIVASARRSLGAIEGLAGVCPPGGDPGRRRFLEVFAHLWGEHGVLAHDTRRLILQLMREENDL